MAVESFGRYQVLRRLGSGGMAEVYEAQDPMLKRRVAIKVIHAHLATDPGFDQRFRREAQLVASLRHPHIIQLYDFGVVDDQPFMVMEYLDGGTLSVRLAQYRARGEKLPPDEVVRLITALASALDYAHERGAVHRDIKPANILFTADEDPVVTDFGIAKILSGAVQLSATGSVMGSPAYMAPEQASGNPVDARSDLYALGIVLYEMLAGRVPYQGDSPTAVMMQHLTGTPPPLRQFNPAVSPALEAVVLKALSKDPAARDATAGDMARAVRAAIYDSNAAPTVVGTADRTLVDAATLESAPATPTAPAGTPAPAKPAAARPAGAARPRWLIPSGIALAVIILGIAAFAFLSGGRFGAAAGPQTAMVRFRDGSAQTDEAVLSLVGMAAPPACNVYEAWLLGNGDESRQRMGVVEIKDGNGTLTYTDPAGKNLLAAFDSVQVTIEPAPGDNALPSNRIALLGSLPPEALVHIRHLLVAREDTPKHIGYSVGLLAQAKLLDVAGNNALASLQRGDLAGIKESGEWLVNVIEGQGGEHFGDVDGNGVVTNPGDGFGLLPAAGRVGYIQGAFDHAGLAADSADATDSVKLHAGHVRIATRNVSEWVVELRDQALQMARAADLSAIEATVRSAASLSTRIVKGQDLNGDERIDPVPGEGGAGVAYEHSQYMADIFLHAP